MTDEPLSPAAAREFAAQALPLLEDVARFARSLAHDTAVAEDLTQETYLRAYRGWRTFESGSDVKSWLFAICRNTHFRTSQREQRHVNVDDAELEALAAGAVYTSAHEQGMSGMWASSDLTTALRHAIDALDPPRRDVVQLVDVEDRSYEEVATILDIPIGTVRSRLFRARRVLQEQLLAHAQDMGFVVKSRTSLPPTQVQS